MSGTIIDPAAEAAEGVRIGPGAFVGAGASIAAGSEIGTGAIIHPGTEVGPDCLIEPLAGLGKRPQLRKHSSVAGLGLGALRIEGGVTVCSDAVVYAGAEIAAETIVGDQAQVREIARIGAGSVVGRASCVDFDSRVRERVLTRPGYTSPEGQWWRTTSSLVLA